MGINISSLTKFFYKKDKSLTGALKKIVGKRRLELLLSHNTDWRELTTDAANLDPAIGAEIHQKIAEYFSVPYIPRIPAIDLGALPSRISVEDLRRFACIPRINNNHITSFICLDPKRAATLISSEKPLPFGIASWATIRSALNESEQMFRAKYEEAREKEALQLVEAAKQALNLIVAQVKNFSVETFNISLAPDNLMHYSFQTNEGKQAKGNINAKIVGALLSILRNFAEKEVAVLEISDIVKQGLKVSKLEGENTYSLEIVKEVAPQQHAAPNVISFPDTYTARSISQDEPLKTSKEYKLLIVDDNQVFAKVLERFLEKLNVKTTYAPNGAQALKLLSEKAIQPDIVICDLHMPEMNGCEFTKRVREELALLDLPVIILTSDDDVETELRLLTEGADAFIAKSEDPRLLCIKVQKLIEKAERRQAA